MRCCVLGMAGLGRWPDQLRPEPAVGRRARGDPPRVPSRPPLAARAGASVHGARAPAEAEQRPGSRRQGPGHLTQAPERAVLALTRSRRSDPPRAG